MAFKKLFVPLTDLTSDTEVIGAKTALDMALSMGHHLDAHVEAYFCAPDSGSGKTILPAGVPGSTADLLIAEFDKAIAAQRHGAEELFDSALDKHHPPRRSQPDETGDFSANFVEETGSFEDRLPARARLADLIVVGLGSDNKGASKSLELCLRDSGRPVLAVPSDAAEWCGETVAIGWNGSAEAAHVVAAASSLLVKAQKVTIIAIDEDGPTDPGAAELAASLAWHGVTADTVTLDGSRDTAGPLLLERANAIGADVLVMGAYTRSRLGRLIFGSATADVLAAATLPVLMMQ